MVETKNFTIHIVEHGSEYAYFEKSADANRYMDIVLEIERESGVEDWDLSCALTERIVQAESWADALSRHQFAEVQS